MEKCQKKVRSLFSFFFLFYFILSYTCCGIAIGIYYTMNSFGVTTCSYNKLWLIKKHPHIDSLSSFYQPQLVTRASCDPVMSELQSSCEKRLFLILPEEMTCRWSINCQVYCWVPLAHNFRNDLMARICNSWSVHAILFFGGMYMQFLKWLAADPLYIICGPFAFSFWLILQIYVDLTLFLLSEEGNWRGSVGVLGEKWDIHIVFLSNSIYILIFDF